MFLFEGDFGRYLHTGDFRWELASQAELLAHPALAGAPLDRLYIDNTYCAPWRAPARALLAPHARARAPGAEPRAPRSYAFPPRLDACRAVIAAVRAHPGHRVLIGVDSLGKGARRPHGSNERPPAPVAADAAAPPRAEELLAAVAAAVGEPVCVPPGRLAAVRLLGLPARLFTTDPAATRLSVLPRHQVRPHAARPPASRAPRGARAKASARR